MAQTTPNLGSNTLAVFILDNSSSMYCSTSNYYGNHRTAFKPLIPSLAENLHSLAKTLNENQITTEFHVFSNTVVSGTDVHALLASQPPRFTNISAGFEAMLQSHDKHDNPKHTVIVFISDGEDSDPQMGRKSRQALAKLPGTSTLLTVAVGSSFPTTTVLNDLYTKYHTSEDRSLPLVLPIDPYADNNEEVMGWIQSQLTDIIIEIAHGVPRKQLTVADLEGMDNQGIFEQCRRWYNECSVRALLPAPLPEKIALVRDLKERLDAVDKLMRRGVAATAKPLLTSHLRKQISVHNLTHIREKINAILAQLNKGRLFEHLSDVEKSEFLAFGNKTGRLLSKAVQYHGANVETSIKSLMKMIEDGPTEADKCVVENIHLCSFEEILLDAKANRDLFAGIGSMPDILRAIAFVGRALELKPIPDGAQMNPWLITVQSLPTIVKFVTTYDLYCTASGVLDVRGETTNNLLILGGSKPGIMTHVQTFTISGWLCYHKDARLAMAAAVLVHLLGSDSTAGLQEWKLAELGLLRSVLDLHTPDNSQWWHEYCDMLQTNPRMCLVTESTELPPSIRCQGLNKPILALWRAIDGGRSYDYAALRDLMLAFVAEFLGRCKVDIKDHVTVDCRPTSCSIEGPWEHVLAQIKTQHLSMQRIVGMFEQQIVNTLRKAARVDAAVSINGNSSLLQLQHFHLTLPEIDDVFTNLARLCKIEQWGPITDDELLRALHNIVSHGSSSMARNSPSSHLTTAEIKQSIAASLAAEAERRVKLSLCSAARERVVTYLHSRHTGLPVTLPSAFMQRYLQETGRDIAKDYDVNPSTGLSRVACCFTRCDLFLEIPKGSKTQTQQRSIIKMHLGDCCKFNIPGLHQSLVAGGTATDVLSKVVSGQCLKTPFPSRSFGKVPHDEFAVQHQKAQQQWRLAKAVDGYNGGDSKALYHLLAQMQESVSGNWWSYAAFKQAFDAKYA
jgi:hypothetical protein